MNSRSVLGVVLAAIILLGALPSLSAAAAEDEGPAAAVSLDIYGNGLNVPVPGGTSDTTTAVLANVGSEAVEVTVTAEDRGDQAVLSKGVIVNGNKAWEEYREVVTAGNRTVFDLALRTSSGVSVDEMEGSVTVWAAATSSSPDEDWTQWQNNVKHYAVTYPDEAVTDPEIAWEYDAGGSIDVTPLVVGGTVYVFDLSGTLHAINKSTGALIWKSTTRSSSDEIPPLESSIPAYGDGKLFVATFNGYIYAFDASTGERLWSVKPYDGYASFECPITYYDNLLYVGMGLAGPVQTKYYYCYDDRGNQVWKYGAERTSGFIWGGAVVVGSYLIFPVFEGKLVSVYRTNGTVSDVVNLKGPSDVSFARPDMGMIRSSVTYSNGSIYSTCENGNAIGYLFKTGFVNGKFTNEGWSTPIRFSTSTPVVYDGRVYVGNGEHGETSGNLTCINDADGSVIWSYQVYSGVKSSPTLAVVGGDIYIYFAVSYGYDDKVFCVNGDGELVWEFDPPDGKYILQGCTLSGDALYFGTDAGVLYCLRNA